MDNCTLWNKTYAPVLDDKVYRMKVDKYMVKYKEVIAKKIALVEFNANIYNLCLQHSPPDLKSVLTSNSRWDKILADQYGFVLIHVIWDITQKQDEKMQSTMEYVKVFLQFSMTYHEPKQSNTDSYALLKSI